MDSQTGVLFGLQSSTIAQAVLRKYYKDARGIFRSCLQYSVNGSDSKHCWYWRAYFAVFICELLHTEIWAHKRSRITSNIWQRSLYLRNSAINICWAGLCFRWDLWKSYWLNYSFSSVYHLHTQTIKYITELNSISNYRGFRFQKHLKTLSTDIHIYVCTV